jgi:hypothetical protein
LQYTIDEATSLLKQFADWLFINFGYIYSIMKPIHQFTIYGSEAAKLVRKQSAPPTTAHKSKKDYRRKERSNCNWNWED